MLKKFADSRLTGAGLIDQALLSAANFGTIVVAARMMHPSGFGQFALAYAAVAFVNGIQLALITQPYVVLAARESESPDERAGATYGLQCGLIAAVAVVAA